MFWIVLFLAQAAAVPSQTERGEALFFDAQQGCAKLSRAERKGHRGGPGSDWDSGGWLPRRLPWRRVPP